MPSKAANHSIAERSKQLLVQLKAYSQLSSGVQVARLYEASRKSLATEIRRLRSIVEALDEMARIGLEVSKDELPNRQILDLVNDVRTKASDDVADAVQSDSFGELVSLMQESGEQLDAYARRTWATYVAGHTVVGVATADLLEQLGLFTDEIEELRSAVAVIQGRQSDTTELPTPDEIGEFFVSLKTYSDAQSAISRADMPDDVRMFLESTTDDGASLADLSDEVLEWIKHHDMTDSFRIVLD